MIFYKIPLNADLSNTSYRVFVLLDDCAFIEFNEGNIENDWIEYTKEQIVDEYGYNVMEQIPSVETSQEEQEDNYEDLIQAELLLNQINIMAKQEEQDEVLAEILLNQLGV